MIIEKTTPDQADVIALLDLHLSSAARQDASHAFGIERLCADDVHFFTARDESGALMGMAALKQIDHTHGEIKSVRTHPDFLRRGVSRALMDHLTEFATDLSMNRLSLETHPTPQYAAARALYKRLGYTYCGPFEGYENTPESVFMTREI